MPSLDIDLPPELERFIADKVAGGQYRNASEVIHAALHVLERDEDNDLKLSALQAAIDAGIASPTAKGTIDDGFTGVLSRRGLSAAQH